MLVVIETIHREVKLNFSMRNDRHSRSPKGREYDGLLSQTGIQSKGFGTFDFVEHVSCVGASGSVWIEVIDTKTRVLCFCRENNIINLRIRLCYSSS